MSIVHTIRTATIRAIEIVERITVGPKAQIEMIGFAIKEEIIDPVDKTATVTEIVTATKGTTTVDAETTDDKPFIINGLRMVYCEKRYFFIVI